MSKHVLAQNQYGKAENRIVAVTRKGNDGAWHEIRDLNVSVALRGEYRDVHLTGDNGNCLPTDTTKNTVYAFAKEHGVTSPEAFGILLAKHFVTSQAVIHEAQIRVEEYAWERISVPTRKEQHSFARKGQEVRTAQITYSANTGLQVLSGLKDLTVMNSTNSEFHGFIKDRYTTLREAYDRILATKVTARWANSAPAAADEEHDWDRSYQKVRRHMLEAFAETYSYSLQQTLHAMADRVLDNVSTVNEVRLNLPNKHHFLVDLEPFGLENDNEVYFAADRMYGLIEGTIHRDGVQPVIATSDWITA
ncbi:urate oxidase [Streptomyces sp. adm13(2018)]|uniref:factor-independent urate hydroxylase n=1 Tax=unclassified Streptomyces TaxID=2593676 RepID=UPI0011CDAAFC|nr:urate oxidase [Streptomyces sp. adm13(2018)]MYS09338.1 urate oxidase [Streptomyces sp. SID6041]TXS20328.1 urate oxidase [Streptomyces sp. adm13(2018)]